jgi:quinol monooxygenase YgiN
MSAAVFDPPQIVVAGFIDLDVAARPDVVAECISATAGFQRATQDEELGCLAYSFSADPLTPGRILVYERWTDADTLLTHFDHPNYHAMRQALASFGIVNVQVERLRVDAARPIYDPDRVARPHVWD